MILLIADVIKCLVSLNLFNITEVDTIFRAWLENYTGYHATDECLRLSRVNLRIMAKSGDYKKSFLKFLNRPKVP